MVNENFLLAKYVSSSLWYILKVTHSEFHVSFFNTVQEIL